MPSMPGTIGLFLRSSDNDYQQRLKELGLREAKRQGFEIVIESAMNDPAKQVEQIRVAIKNAASTKLVGILVSTVRDEGLPEAMSEAAEQGIDCALLNEGSFIDEIHAKYPGRAIFAVTSDQAEIGRIHGRQVHTLVGDKGRVLTVTGPLSTVMAQQRLAGLKEILGADFSVVELNADWTSERARMAVERWS
jgi:ABC-type sugar transport system substrate-binding protein